MIAARLRAGVLGTLAVGALAACNPTLAAQSAAPPGRAARLDSIDGFWGIKAYRLELSQGVAIAITCNRGGPCEDLRLASDDPAIADVRTGALSKLEPNHGYDANQATAAALVIVGKAPGTTIVRVRAREGHRDIFVTVVPPPAVNPQTAVSR